MQLLEREDGRRSRGEKGAETAWTVYRATHPDVGARASRRCLLEHHLQGRREARVGDAEELASFGLPASASRRRMLTDLKMLIARVARGSTRPIWTLLAISYLFSAVIVMALRCAFGA